VGIHARKRAFASTLCSEIIQKIKKFRRYHHYEISNSPALNGSSSGTMYSTKCDIKGNEAALKARGVKPRAAPDLPLVEDRADIVFF
jgi:hypothetical protein